MGKVAQKWAMQFSDAKKFPNFWRWILKKSDWKKIESNILRMSLNNPISSRQLLYSESLYYITWTGWRCLIVKSIRKLALCVRKQILLWNSLFHKKCLFSLSLWVWLRDKDTYTLLFRRVYCACSVYGEPRKMFGKCILLARRNYVPSHNVNAACIGRINFPSEVSLWVKERVWTLNFSPHTYLLRCRV